jgi:hypothetical protein
MSTVSRTIASNECKIQEAQMTKESVASDGALCSLM